MEAIRRLGRGLRAKPSRKKSHKFRAQDDLEALRMIIAWPASMLKGAKLADLPVQQATKIEL
jgi:hypothetical protein